MNQVMTSATPFKKELYLISRNGCFSTVNIQWVGLNNVGFVFELEQDWSVRHINYWWLIPERE